MDHATIDFETRSFAGFVFEPFKNIWKSPYFQQVSEKKKGLKVVGTAAYAEHPTTEVICLSYRMPDGRRGNWSPLDSHELIEYNLKNDSWTLIDRKTPPKELLDYIAGGGLVEAHKVGFEQHIWNFVCVRKYGWPKLDPRQLRCSMAKCYAFNVMPGLGAAALFLGTDAKKDKIGKSLIDTYTYPRNPTKKDPDLFKLVEKYPQELEKFMGYCDDDVAAEHDVSNAVPDLNPFEEKVFITDRLINTRGLRVDMEAVQGMAKIVTEYLRLQNKKLYDMTEETVKTASEVGKLAEWITSKGYPCKSVAKDAVDAMILDPDLPKQVKDALELRRSVAGSSVKKCYAILKRVNKDGRLRELFQYGGANTLRWTGSGPQPHNLPNSGPKVQQCDAINGCGHHYGSHLTKCPWCGIEDMWSATVDWSPEAAEDAITCIKTGDYHTVKRVFGEVAAPLQGSLRACFIAAEGMDLICSDYNAIEGVGAAMLAQEPWRIEVFRTHGKIYEMAVSDICGIPFEEVMGHAGYNDLSLDEWWTQPQTGSHHPLRKTHGKIFELAKAYGGKRGACIQFGADKFMTDEEIDDNVRKWEAASPNIVAHWWECQRAAEDAIRHPGVWFQARLVHYQMYNGALVCCLPSGHYIYYQGATIEPVEKPWGVKDGITFWTYNTNPKNGPVGKWIKRDTYGPRLFQNNNQSACRDIMANCLVNLEEAGYRPVLHVHDEPVGEVPEGWGSVEEFERIITPPPEWAKDWPIRASGGWRSKRYRKD